MQNLCSLVDSWRMEQPTEYHVLDPAKLNTHPKTLGAFRDWLKGAFAAVQGSLEHPLGIDESDLEFCTAVVRRASLTVARLGGGHLGEPVHVQHLHASALAVLGRMLAWVEEQQAKGVTIGDRQELTVPETAIELSVHPKTVRKYIAEGVLPARDVAPPSSNHHDWRIPVAAVQEMRAAYRKHTVAAPIKPAAVPRARSFTPKLLAWGD